jgi:NADPH-dependent F420 reductase
MNLGFLGGTGVEGRGLALRFASAGAGVIVGSRSGDRAAAAAGQCNAALGRPLVRGMTNDEMLATADPVFLTVPYERALEAVSSVGRSFRAGTILVDVTVPVSFRSGRPEYDGPPDLSGAEAIAACLPAGVELVAAFKTLPAHLLADLSESLECDEFVCGDSPDARQKVAGVIRVIPSLRALDAGPLSSARILERMTILAIGLNRRYRRRGARYRVVGVDDQPSGSQP